MNTVLTIITVAAGLGFLFTIFNLLRKGGKIAAKLPTNFLIFFLIYALLGLTGFLLKERVAENPIILGILISLVSLTGGTIMTNKLYDTWDWSMAAGFGKKALYLFGIALVSMFAFILVFLLCEHKGLPKISLKSDIVWWLSGLSFTILLPLLVKHLHLLWNEIPKLYQVKPTFVLPIGSSPPFMETGGRTVKFEFVIPLDYQSTEKVQSKVAVPLEKSLEEAFHYKIHDHNIVKRIAKKIIYAEENKRAKIYGWCFYRTAKTWWGWRTKKSYCDPTLQVGTSIANGETIFVERVKVWEQGQRENKNLLSTS